MHRSLVVAVLLFVVLTLTIGCTRAHVRFADEQTAWLQPRDVDRAPSQISDPPPPAIHCITAPCPGAPTDASVEGRENERPSDSHPASELPKPWSVNAPEEDEWEAQQQEVAAVRLQRMAQLERTRQHNAINDLPPLPTTRHQPTVYDAKVDADMQALADLLVMLDAVAAAEAQQEQEAMAGREGQTDEGMSEVGVVSEVVEEVVVVVAGDRWGRSMLIEMHRQIYHTDSSPCSHFTTPSQQQQQQQGQFETLPQPELDESADAWVQRQLAAQARQAAEDAEAGPRWSLPLAERVIIAVGLLSAVALFAATVLCACVIRHKRHQQRVLLEPPSVQQLGLDVPMLSSSPSMSGQVLQL